MQAPSDTAGSSSTISQKSKKGLGIVLLTPDDVATREGFARQYIYLHTTHHDADTGSLRRQYIHEDAWDDGAKHSPYEEFEY
eukprot:scaffold12161_cov297-Chaetoceros_neogracile.AAC.16